MFRSFENNKGMFWSQSQDIYYFVKVTSIFFKITNTRKCHPCFEKVTHFFQNMD